MSFVKFFSFLEYIDEVSYYNTTQVKNSFIQSGCEFNILSNLRDASSVFYDDECDFLAEKIEKVYSLLIAYFASSSTEYVNNYSLFKELLVRIKEAKSIDEIEKAINDRKYKYSSIQLYRHPMIDFLGSKHNLPSHSVAVLSDNNKLEFIEIAARYAIIYVFINNLKKAYQTAFGNKKLSETEISNTPALSQLFKLFLSILLDGLVNSIGYIHGYITKAWQGVNRADKLVLETLYGRLGSLTASVDAQKVYTYTATQEEEEEDEIMLSDDEKEILTTYTDEDKVKDLDKDTGDYIDESYETDDEESVLIFTEMPVETIIEKMESLEDFLEKSTSKLKNSYRFVLSYVKDEWGIFTSKLKKKIEAIDKVINNPELVSLIASETFIDYLDMIEKDKNIYTSFHNLFYKIDIDDHKIMYPFANVLENIKLNASENPVLLQYKKVIENFIHNYKYIDIYIIIASVKQYYQKNKQVEDFSILDVLSTLRQAVVIFSANAYYDIIKLSTILAYIVQNTDKVDQQVENFIKNQIKYIDLDYEEYSTFENLLKTAYTPEDFIKSILNTLVSKIYVYNSLLENFYLLSDEHKGIKNIVKMLYSRLSFNLIGSSLDLQKIAKLRKEETRYEHMKQTILNYSYNNRKIFMVTPAEDPNFLYTLKKVNIPDDYMHKLYGVDDLPAVVSPLFENDVRLIIKANAYIKDIADSALRKMYLMSRYYNHGITNLGLFDNRLHDLVIEALPIVIEYYEKTRNKNPDTNIILDKYYFEYKPEQIEIDMDLLLSYLVSVGDYLNSHNIIENIRQFRVLNAILSLGYLLDLALSELETHPKEVYALYSKILDAIVSVSEDSTFYNKEKFISLVEKLKALDISGLDYETALSSISQQLNFIKLRVIQNIIKKKVLHENIENLATSSMQLESFYNKFDNPKLQGIKRALVLEQNYFENIINYYSSADLDNQIKQSPLKFLLVYYMEILSAKISDNEWQVNEDYLNIISTNQKFTVEENFYNKLIDKHVKNKSTDKPSMSVHKFISALYEVFEMYYNMPDMSIAFSRRNKSLKYANKRLFDLKVSEMLHSSIKGQYESNRKKLGNAKDEQMSIDIAKNIQRIMSNYTITNQDKYIAVLHNLLDTYIERLNQHR
jgi:hypothetical protein